jgi:hypothetical protein
MVNKELTVALVNSILQAPAVTGADHVAMAGGLSLVTSCVMVLLIFP